jgi:hypothetical protein
VCLAGWIIGDVVPDHFHGGRGDQVEEDRIPPRRRSEARDRDSDAD